MALGPVPSTATTQNDARIDSTHHLIRFLSRTSFRTRLLSGVWVLFLVLVALGIHGSSIPFAAEWWEPEWHYSGYVFGFIPNLATGSPRINNLALKELAMTQPRSIRSDEWLVTTPLALAQLAHNPRFPVVNTNIGDGQNMLINPSVPVLHPTLLARPVTWGYFLLGGQRGLAWSWWFQVFSCFTALFLLLEIILAGRQRLAAFGAFWFCGSAYVVCFSLLPAYYAALPALMCVAAYYILSSNRRAVQLAGGSVLGISAAGFFMLLYPPWQIPLAYLVLLVFVALVYRDRLYRKLWPISRSRALAILIAVVIGGALISAFLATCLPALKVMAATVYPGQRAADAGGYKVRVFFRGLYNLISVYSAPAELGNQSEASSFYYFFPPILLALALSRRLRSRIGVVGLALSAYILLMGLFAFLRIPAIMAKVMFLSYAVPGRTDIGFGLASIMLSIMVLAASKAVDGQAGCFPQPSDLPKLSKLSKLPKLSWVPAIASSAFAVLVVATGVMLSLVAGGFPPVSAAMLAALVCGFLSFCLLTGKQKIFCYIVGAAVVATMAFFNPLSTNLDFLYKSELAQKIIELNGNADAPRASALGVPSGLGASPEFRIPPGLGASPGLGVPAGLGASPEFRVPAGLGASPGLGVPARFRVSPEFGVPASAGSLPHEQKPLWLCYGLAYPEIQVQILGGRALPGIQWPPQLGPWRRLDPSGAYERVYNRYAHIQLGVNGDSQQATFTSPRDDTMVVNVSPTNPVFAAMGARYVLAMYKYQENIDKLGLPVIYKSQTGSFTIYGIPGQ